MTQQGSARRCAAMLSAARLSGAWGTPPLLRVVGLAVGLGLRRVFVRVVLRLLDWWVRPRTVRVRHAGIGRGSGWRLDTGAFPVVGRYFDRFALRFAWFALHGYVRRAREFALMISQAPCQRVAHARYAGGLDRCDVSTIAGRLFQSGFATRSANRRRRRRAYRENGAGTPLARHRAQGVGDIGFVQPSHEPSSIHPGAPAPRFAAFFAARASRARSATDRCPGAPAIQPHAVGW